MKSCKAFLGSITSKPGFEPFPIPVEKISLYTLGMNVYVTGMDIGGEGGRTTLLFWAVHANEGLIFKTADNSTLHFSVLQIKTCFST
jgi:hypothetical protein